MRRCTKLVVAIGVAALTLTACGSDGEDVATRGTDGGDPAVTITSPEDGASVEVPFMLEWDSSSELGPIDSGRDHVHVYVDENTDDYSVVEGNEFQLEDLSPGEHIVEVSLQHADHSPVGPKSTITVTVAGGGGGGGSESPSPEDSGGDGGGLGY